MITCPKCGFEQPKDKFCAKCGINMEVFAAANQNRMKKWGSTFTFYGAVLGLLAGGFFFVYMAQTPELNKSSSDQISESIPTSAAVTKAALAPSPTPVQRPSPQASVAPSALFAQFGGLGKDPETTPSAVNKPKASQVSIEFVTFNPEVSEGFNQGAQGRLELGRYALAIQNSEIQKLESMTGFDSLAQETRKLSQGQSTLVFRGVKEPKSGETLGLYIEITPVRVHEKGADYTVSIKRSLIEGVNPADQKPVSVNFDESIPIPNGATLAISGLLPRKPMTESEFELYKSSFLKVMGDPDFQSGDKDLVILVRPHMTTVDQ
ncbi:MAG: zinc ribbon domain-containing protein [Oligoflexia bacterium]|nr:zinc ribbon domain-containing protein [Oligoflexia bacterium]